MPKTKAQWSQRHEQRHRTNLVPTAGAVPPQVRGLGNPEPEPELDLDRLVWDPEYRAAMRPLIKRGL